MNRRMSKVISAAAAAALIKDGATVGAAACAMSGWPEEISIAMEKQFLASGHPAKLTLVHAAGIGNWKDKGPNHFAHPGMIGKWIGGHCGLSPDFAKLVLSGGCEGYNLPQGVISQLWREIAARRPGMITKTGIGTYVDPRLEGGKMNSISTKDMVKVITFEGEEWLFYAGFPVDVAIIRGTTADENGNLSIEDEGAWFEILPLAQAAKNSGGIVIAEVKYVALSGTLNPKEVRVPGVLVDHIVVSEPANHWQSAKTPFNPAFAGRTREPIGSIPAMALDERLIIARRAAMELTPGAAVNFGVGIPQGIAGVTAVEGVPDLAVMTSETGTIGGVPADGHDFGMSYNADAFVEQMVQFDWYSGGGLDIAFESFAQVDAAGNVNVSKFNGKSVGCGGFIDITQHAKKVVYVGSFTAGGLKLAAANGTLKIATEGKHKKYVKQVEQITSSGAYATKVKQPVIFVTERCVFELQNGQLVLTEIAPGIDIDKDILAQMDFKPKTTPAPKLMDAGIFQDKWGGLKKIIDAKSKTEPTRQAAE
jgi:propionate CoA-transferase